MPPAAALPPAPGGFRRTLKGRPRPELLCDYAFRPLAHPLVLALARMRVPPPAVVVAHFALGLVAAALLWTENLVAAAVLLQAKTLLDNADGQLARATGRVTALGRYLDTEADFVVNVALFAALAHVTGQPLLALAGLGALTLLLSVDVNLEPLYREAHGEPARPAPPADGDSRATRTLAAVYAAAFAPQDRLVRSFSRGRLERLLGEVADPRARLRATRAYHDPLTLTVTANLELTTQLAVLGACLVLGAPSAYAWFAVACLALLPLLQARRERRARNALRA